MANLKTVEIKAFVPARDYLARRYGVRMGKVERQPWRMRDFVLIDPSGVLWRMAQNVD